jgi:hypothetical protein
MKWHLDTHLQLPALVFMCCERGFIAIQALHTFCELRHAFVLRSLHRQQAVDVNA